MSFCTQTDLTNRKGTKAIAELTGDPDGETVNAARVTLAIDEFAERIQAALNKQYRNIEFDETNKLLNGLNIKGAYLLLEQDSYDGWSEENREDWKLLMKDIENISSGKLDLKIETEEEEDATVEGYFSTNPRLFGRNSLNGVEA
ncbi:MAG: DUF1320 family protein [Balneola sp.]